MRPSRLAIALLAAMIAAPAAGQEARLPDIGSSAADVLSPAKQSEYGAMTLAQLRAADYVLDDPLLEGWLETIGGRLSGGDPNLRERLTLFLLRERQINAFATLGGYIGVNAGLVLAADREDQVAGVLAHEIAHVSQKHVLRGVEKSQRESLPILLATLGAIIAAQQAQSDSPYSNSNPTMGALAVGMGLLQQRVIDYTRHNEAEADRVGIRTLASAGYDPAAMAEFFQVLQGHVRNNQGTERERVPGYLQTHPVTLSRISEARERADQLRKAPPPAAIPAASVPGGNPLLPSGLQLPTAAAAPAPASRQSGSFGWARERLRVLSATTPAGAIREYEQMAAKAPLDDAQRYGRALAQLRAGQAAVAAQALATLLDAHPGDLWLEVTLGEAQARSGQLAAADARFERLLQKMSSHRGAALTFARLLAERNTPAAGQRAVAVLRPLQAVAADDPIYQQTLARASEIAGDPVRAGEAWAEAAYLGGRPEQALVQLGNLKKRGDLDYYARTRIDARIAQITPVVLELHRQGVRDEQVDTRRR